jgi:hypothetical protein
LGSSFYITADDFFCSLHDTKHTTMRLTQAIMRLVGLLIILQTAQTLPSHAQTQTPTQPSPLITNASEQDALGALPVCDTLFVQPNAYRGAGRMAEVNGSTCIGVERNSAWYRITAGADGFFGFVIEPLFVSDDYDWAVYKIPTGESLPAFAARLASITQTASCNFAQATSLDNRQFLGRTGAISTASGDRQTSRGTPFNARIPVVRGEMLLLVVTTFPAAQSGYRLRFGESSTGVIRNADTLQTRITAAVPSMSEGGACSVRSFTVNFSKLLRCESVQPLDFRLQGSDTSFVPALVRSERCGLSPLSWDSTYTIVFTEPISRAGAYTLALTAASGGVSDLCGNVSTSATLAVSITFPTFRPSIGGAREFCAGGSTTLDAGGGYVSYAWRKISTGTTGTTGTTGATGATGATTSANDILGSAQTLAVSTVGTYSVEVQDKSGCIGRDTVRVQLRTEPLRADIAGLRFVCGSSSGSGSAATRLDAGDFLQYRWSNGATTRTIDVSQPGTYSVTVTNEQGCTASTQATISIRSTPLTTLITGRLQFCEGGTTTLDAGTVEGSGTEFQQYQWTQDGQPLAGETKRFFTTNRSGTIAVRVGVNGCTGESPSVRVSAAALPPQPQITQRGNVLIAPEASAYQWFNEFGTAVSDANAGGSSGGTAREFSPQFSGRYSVRVSNQAGCTAQSVLFSITRSEANATFDVGSASGKAGDFVEIPITLRGAAGVLQSGATALGVTLRLNGRLLIPTPEQPSAGAGANAGAGAAGTTVLVSIQDSLLRSGERIERLVRVTARVAQGQIPSDGVFARIRFQAMLGNTTTTTIVLDNAQSEPPRAIAVSVGSAGRFDLTGVATEGTIRLIDTPFRVVQTIALQTSPNPASSQTLVKLSLAQADEISLVVMNALGNPVRTIATGAALQAGAHEFVLPTSDLPQGAYFLVAKGANTRATQALTIIR